MLDGWQHIKSWSILSDWNFICLKHINLILHIYIIWKFDVAFWLLILIGIVSTVYRFWVKIHVIFDNLRVYFLLVWSNAHVHLAWWLKHASFQKWRFVLEFNFRRVWHGNCWNWSEFALLLLVHHLPLSWHIGPLLAKFWVFSGEVIESETRGFIQVLLDRDMHTLLSLLNVAVNVANFFDHYYFVR